MNLIDYEHFINTLPDPTKFTQSLETMQSQLPPILADFQNAYISHNRNPNNQEYQQTFQNVKSNLNTINSQLFTLSNKVQSEIDKMNSKLAEIDVMIKKERSRNKELKRKLGIVEHDNNAAFELIFDYKEIYKSKYLSNWALFLSILFVIATISKIYGKPKITNLTPAPIKAI